MTDLFQQQQQDDLPPLDDNTDFLVELTKPGGKFDRTKYQSDAEMHQAIAKGKYLGDHTVDVYKQRMDEFRAENLKLREENVAKAKLEELIDQMQQKRLDSDNTQAREDGPKPLNSEDVESLFDRKYQERRASERQTDNLNVVQNKLKELWGENFPRFLKQKTEELDLTEDEVNNMAKNNPKLLFRTIGLDQQPVKDVFTSLPRSQQRSDSFAPSAPKQRTWAYWQELKKTNPGLYFDRKTAIQMAKDAVELGEAFHDGNYFVPGMHDKQ